MFNQNHDDRTSINTKHDPIITDAKNAGDFSKNNEAASRRFLDVFLVFRQSSVYYFYSPRTRNLGNVNLQHRL